MPVVYYLHKPRGFLKSTEVMSDDDQTYIQNDNYDSEEEWNRIKNRDFFDDSAGEDSTSEGSETECTRGVKRPRSPNSDEEHGKKKQKIEKETTKSQESIDKLLDEAMELIEPDLEVDLTASTQKIPDTLEAEEEVISEKVVKVRKLPRTLSYYSQEELFDSELSWYANKEKGNSGPIKQYNPMKWDKGSGNWKCISRKTKK